MDARDDARCAEKYEAAKNDGCAVAPVNAAGQHQKADRSDCDYGNDGCDGAKKGVLKPRNRRNENPRPCRTIQADDSANIGPKFNSRKILNGIITELFIAIVLIIWPLVTSVKWTNLINNLFIQ